LAVWFRRAEPRPWEVPDGKPDPAKAVSDDGTPRDVALVSVETGKPVARLTNLPEQIRAVLFGADASRLATCGTNNEVRVWDAAGKLLRTLACEGAKQAVPVAFTPDGQSLVTNCVSETVTANGTFLNGTGEFRVWDLESGKTRATGPIAPYADRKFSWT